MRKQLHRGARVAGRSRSAAAAEAQRTAHAPHGTWVSGLRRDAAVHRLARRRGRRGLLQDGKGVGERGRHRHEKQCQSLPAHCDTCLCPRPCNTCCPDRYSQHRAAATALTVAATGDLPPEDLKLGDCDSPAARQQRRRPHAAQGTRIIEFRDVPAYL